jgi:hypothetical protein
MAIVQADIKPYWNYYLALEQDLSNLARFVELDQNNYHVHSIELAHLLLAASSEVDVILKEFCSLKNSSKRHKNIDDYRDTVKSHVAAMINEKCYISRFGLTLTPWVNWSPVSASNPDWWRSYNNVKHQRNTSFREANLENTLNAMAALHIVNIYYQKELEEQRLGKEISMKDATQLLQPEASLIKCKDEYYYSRLLVG